jgi:hypothetical protein
VLQELSSSAIPPAPIDIEELNKVGKHAEVRVIKFDNYLQSCAVLAPLLLLAASATGLGVADSTLWAAGGIGAWLGSVGLAQHEWPSAGSRLSAGHLLPPVGCSVMDATVIGCCWHWYCSRSCVRTSCPLTLAVLTSSSFLKLPHSLTHSPAHPTPPRLRRCVRTSCPVTWPAVLTSSSCLITTWLTHPVAHSSARSTGTTQSSSWMRHTTYRCAHSLSCCHICLSTPCACALVRFPSTITGALAAAPSTVASSRHIPTATQHTVVPDHGGSRFAFGLGSVPGSPHG